MKLQSIISMTFFLLFSALSLIYLDLLQYSDKAADTGLMEKVVTVYPGQGFDDLADRLYESGIIKNPIKFKLFARIKGYDKRIKAGEYTLSPSMPPVRIFEVLVRGKVRLYRVTIPEGYNLRQIASIIAATGFSGEADFLSAATDPLLVHEMGIDADTFEGYLFPDTYFLPKGITPKEIIARMVKRFQSVFTLEWKRQVAKLHFSIHQVVTLASLIEKETGSDFEHPIVSSVFHNRLKRKMCLESDPTVIYGINDFDGNITRKHLLTPTPHNTYTKMGLPPGPIANSGIKAIEAALYPADTDFLYFVSKKDGTHKFSTNIKDHNRAVRKYQLRQ